MNTRFIAQTYGNFNHLQETSVLSEKYLLWGITDKSLQQRLFLGESLAGELLHLPQDSFRRFLGQGTRLWTFLRIYVTFNLGMLAVGLFSSGNGLTAMCFKWFVAYSLGVTFNLGILAVGLFSSRRMDWWRYKYFKRFVTLSTWGNI